MEDLIEKARHYGERNAKATAALNHLFTLVIDAAVAALMVFLAAEVAGTALAPFVVALAIIFGLSAVVRFVVVVIILVKVAHLARRRPGR